MNCLTKHKRYITIWLQPTLSPLWLLVSHAVACHKLSPLLEFPSSLSSTLLTSELSSLANSSRKLILTLLPMADFTPGSPYDHSARKTSPVYCWSFCYYFFHFFIFSVELWVSWCHGLYFISISPVPTIVVTIQIIILVVLSWVSTISLENILETCRIGFGCHNNQETLLTFRVGTRDNKHPVLYRTVSHN